jgi:hypothetical protein
MVSSSLAAPLIDLHSARRLPSRYVLAPGPAAFGTRSDGKNHYVSVRQDALEIDCSIADMPRLNRQSICTRRF